MYNDKKVGLSIITYQRPKFCDEAWRSAWERLQGIVDYWLIVDDGSGPAHQISYDQIESVLPPEFIFIRCLENRSVAAVKNVGLRSMMEAGCDYLFLMEDDQRIIDSKAVTGYIDAAEQAGVHHLNFAHHGLYNLGYKQEVKDGRTPFDQWNGLDIFPACVGAWSFYTRHCIETVGYMDEYFKNAYEHVEHTARIAHAGLTAPFWSFADAPGSENWIHEQPNAVQSSTMKDTPEKMRNIDNMLQHWRDVDKKTWPQV